jgi:predicted lipoprotein with Yx(FWY)xxD motif
MLGRTRFLAVLLAIPAIAAGVAACGGGDDDSGDMTAAGSEAGSTVSVESLGDAGEVLVDEQGAALYTNDRDTASKIACTGECTSIWVPLSASNGAPTSDDSSVEGKLGTIDRPDGTRQVTFEGKPLYSFVEDGPGAVTGDGLPDSFGGTEFVWTVARSPGGSAAPGGGAETDTSEEDGGVGRYGY